MICLIVRGDVWSHQALLNARSFKLTGMIIHTNIYSTRAYLQAFQFYVKSTLNLRSCACKLYKPRVSVYTSFLAYYNLNNVRIMVFPFVEIAWIPTKNILKIGYDNKDLNKT